MMAESEGKQKKRKISAIFKKKSKEHKEHKEEHGISVSAVKETEEKRPNDPVEQELVQADDVDSQQRKKKKLGQRRFLSSRKRKTKKQREEDKTSQTAAEKEECIEGKDDKSEKDRDEPNLKVQNVQLKCESPEPIVQSDYKESTVQTMAIVINEDNIQPEDTKSTVVKEESENSKGGSVIRSLLRQDVTPEGSIPTDKHPKYPSVSTRNEDSDKKSEETKYTSEEVGKFVPNIFISNFIDMMMPGSKSKDTGYPSNTTTENVYKLVLHTADKTYSTLVSLINTFLTRAGQIPRQVLVNFLVYLIKKYPQCFKIKKIKRRAVLAEDQVPRADTVK